MNKLCDPSLPYLINLIRRFIIFCVCLFFGPSALWVNAVIVVASKRPTLSHSDHRGLSHGKKRLWHVQAACHLSPRQDLHPSVSPDSARLCLGCCDNSTPAVFSLHSFHPPSLRESECPTSPRACPSERPGQMHLVGRWSTSPWSNGIGRRALTAWLPALSN